MAEHRLADCGDAAVVLDPDFFLPAPSREGCRAAPAPRDRATGRIQSGTVTDEIAGDADPDTNERRTIPPASTTAAFIMERIW